MRYSLRLKGLFCYRKIMTPMEKRAEQKDEINNKFIAQMVKLKTIRLDLLKKQFLNFYYEVPSLTLTN